MGVDAGGCLYFANIKSGSCCQRLAWCAALTESGRQRRWAKSSGPPPPAPAHRSPKGAHGGATGVGVGVGAGLCRTGVRLPPNLRQRPTLWPLLGWPFCGLLTAAAQGAARNLPCRALAPLSAGRRRRRVRCHGRGLGCGSCRQYMQRRAAGWLLVLANGWLAAAGARLEACALRASFSLALCRDAAAAARFIGRQIVPYFFECRGGHQRQLTAHAGSWVCACRAIRSSLPSEIKT
jgi:hypothetical protein